MRWKRVWQIFSGAVVQWNEDKVPRMAGAMAFYTLFSLTPVVVIAVAVAGSFVGREAALEGVLDQVEFLIGTAGREAIQLLVKHAPEREVSLAATMIGVATMFFGATGVFTELQDSLDTIWEVQPKPGLGIIPMIRDRFLSFAMVLVIGFLLLVSLMTSALLAAITSRFTGFVPPEWQIVQVSNFVVSFLVITFLFALIYKVLPDAHVPWRDVWLGAAFTAIMFTVGKSLFGLYLGHSSIGSSYGAAGSLVIVVLWTYYSALILLFGAELTFVQSRLRGQRIEPTENAVHLTEHDRIQQGIPREGTVEQSVADDEARRSPVQLPITPESPSHMRRVVYTVAAFAFGWLLRNRR